MHLQQQGISFENCSDWIGDNQEVNRDLSLVLQTDLFQFVDDNKSVAKVQKM